MFSCLVVSDSLLPRWHSGEESACQCRRCKRCGFDSWVGKIPWRRKWQPTPVSLPGESHEQRSLEGYSFRVYFFGISQVMGMSLLFIRSLNQSWVCGNELTPSGPLQSLKTGARHQKAQALLIGELGLWVSLISGEGKEAADQVQISICGHDSVHQAHVMKAY